MLEIENLEYVLLGFSLHFFVNILIVIFGIGLIINGRKQEGVVQRQYSLGIGLFFCSISLSVITYGIDLASRTFFGPRIFPAALEYEAMGYVFASFHIESYFIGMIMFFALSLAALMYPVEKNILNRNKNVMSIICLIAAPIPAIIRILELITLPQADTPLFYFYSTLFVLVWLVIFASALTVIYIYLKIAVKSVGEIRRKTIAILVALVLWLVLSFRVSNFLKHITDKPWTFWIVPFLEIMVLILFMYGYSDLTGTDMSDFSLKEFAHNPYFKVFVIGLFASIVIALSIFFWEKDLELVIYWYTRAQTDPALYAYGDLMGRTLFEGEGFGGQDPSFILALVAALLYLISLSPKFENTKFGKSRLYLGFIVATALVSTVVNRAFKAYFARVRPMNVMEDPSLYSRIFEWGEYGLSRALSRGSFTSGHTTAASLLFVFAFILITYRKKWVTALVFILTSTWVVMMAFARVVAAAHYPGDTLWGAVISFVLTAYVYYTLRIQEQEKGEFKPKHRGYALLWAIWTSILLLAVFVFAVGIKYSLLEFEWYWPIASIVAVPLAYVSLNQMKNALKPAEVPSVERRSEPEKESEPVSE